MGAQAILVALALVLAPLRAQAADLVVWWEKGYYDQEDEAVREIVAAFEQETGKQVELVFQQQNELPQKILAALDAGHPPTSLSAFGLSKMSGNGPSTIGWRTSRMPLVISRTSSIPKRSNARCYSTGKPGKRHSMQCRWLTRSTTSTFGKTC
jgi:hypothetical protein